MRTDAIATMLKSSAALNRRFRIIVIEFFSQFNVVEDHRKLFDDTNKIIALSFSIYLRVHKICIIRTKFGVRAARTQFLRHQL